MGRLEIPEDQDVATLLLADGKLVVTKNRSKIHTLGQLPKKCLTKPYLLAPRNRRRWQAREFILDIC